MSSRQPGLSLRSSSMNKDSMAADKQGTVPYSSLSIPYLLWNPRKNRVAYDMIVSFRSKNGARKAIATTAAAATIRDHEAGRQLVHAGRQAYRCTSVPQEFNSYRRTKWIFDQLLERASPVQPSPTLLMEASTPIFAYCTSPARVIVCISASQA